MKDIVIRQYQKMVNTVAKDAQGIAHPPEGWIRTVRKALGMSGAQLARRLGATRAFVSQTEKNELNGSITVKNLQKMAEAMGCRFVYSLVPVTGNIEDLIAARAKDKAKKLVEKTGKHMALEAQALSVQQMCDEIERLQKRITYEMPRDLWDND